MIDNLHQNEKWVNTLAITPRLDDNWDKVELHNKVMEGGYPNAWGARIPIYSKWNVPLLKTLLHGYHDQELTMWLTYGWLISRPPYWPDPMLTFSNHASTTDYPEEMERYINKERGRDAIAGPFPEIPFTSRIGLSPLSTRAKCNSQEHRIIMDLSWPPGQSVNDGIAKNQYLGFNTKLTFPTVDVIAKRVMELKQGSSEEIELFKIDLSGYFRQIPLDPGDYSLLCFSWNKEFYFDLVSPQGLRSAPYFAQRLSNAISYVHNSMNYFLFNYIDDFIGCEYKSEIHDSFELFQQTLHDIGLVEVKGKRVSLTGVLNCVGTLVDARKCELRVLPERLTDLSDELRHWEKRKKCSLKQLKSLIGKLQFVCTVV